jgi:hypothetical protein
MDINERRQVAYSIDNHRRPSLKGVVTAMIPA